MTLFPLDTEGNAVPMHNAMTLKSPWIPETQKLTQRVCCALRDGHHPSYQKELGYEEFRVYDHVPAGLLKKHFTRHPIWPSGLCCEGDGVPKGH